MSNKTLPELAVEVFIAAIPAIADKNTEGRTPEELANELGEAFKVLYRHVQEAYYAKSS